ncbi:uncharacterized protein LOC124900137 [Capsicum annuum]|uniref:uncharacterized protein LOC124900137 n=1 Tax=Capsicum annuum TaxID=4072 RepID=UPI001FB0A710|nr:uncharacterized protein LOC124900137 [Capsicum annuum]
MTTRRTTATSPMAIVTPASGIQQQLAPLTFGNFLPHSIHSICEQKELEADLDPAGRRISTRLEDSQFPPRLQFSEAGSSTHTTPGYEVVGGSGALYPPQCHFPARI